MKSFPRHVKSNRPPWVALGRGGLVGVFAVLLLGGSLPVEAFSFPDVRARAEALASHPYQSRTNQVPDAFGRMNYDQYWQLKNRRTNFWQRGGLPLGLQFFPQGYLFKHGVLLHEIVAGEVRAIPFNADLFDYGTNRFNVSSDLQFAGFRLLEFSPDFGEVASFLGASYFRMIGHGQAFGTSPAFPVVFNARARAEVPNAWPWPIMRK